MLTLKITRTSPTHHKLEYRRSDGTGEVSEMETKSLLFHDLLHFSLESEAHLKGGFFGLLSAGHSYAQLSGKAPSEHDSHAAMVIERIVGPLDNLVDGKMDAAAYIVAMRNAFSAYGEEMPEWLTEELLSRVKERFRKLKGEWNSLKFGETLELSFA